MSRKPREVRPQSEQAVNSGEKAICPFSVCLNVLITKLAIEAASGREGAGSAARGAATFAPGRGSA